MVFDLEMIKNVYTNMAERINAARKVVNKPLTLTEKILYSHLDEGFATKAYERGASYVDFNPDRVAMQDATAQMALLQFMQAGKEKVAVPSTVHADHLIQAKIGANEDLSTAKITNREVYRLDITDRDVSMIFWLQYPISMELVFGNQELELFIRSYWRIMHFQEV